jgi:hypothetical protein
MNHHILKLSTLALIALTGLAPAAMAQSNCSSTVTTVDLDATTKSLTGVDIQNAIDAASGTTRIRLNGSFKVPGTLSFKNKSCISLEGLKGAATSTLVWAGPASLLGADLITSGATHDVTVRNLTLQGRGISLVGDVTGVANHRIEGLRIVRPTGSDSPDKPGPVYIVRLLPPSAIVTKGWTFINNVISTEWGVNPLGNTGVMGYNADNVTLSGNRFVNIDTAVHFQGISNATISRNTGTGIGRSALELQDGYSDYSATAKLVLANKNVRITDNVYTDWHGNPKEVLGFSLANGSNYYVANNVLLFKGSTLDQCAKTPLPGGNRWGVELTLSQSRVYNNTVCGFDWGFRSAYFGVTNPSALVGPDTLLIDSNKFYNLNLSAFEMFAQVGPETWETAAEALARWTQAFEANDRRVHLLNNVVQNARIVAFAGGGGFMDCADKDKVKVVENGNDVWYCQSVAKTGEVRRYKRLSFNLFSHLQELRIEGNQIQRQYGFFAEDVVPSANTGYNDNHFTAIAVPPLRSSSGKRATALLSVRNNTLSLENTTSAALTPVVAGAKRFAYTGIDASFVYSPEAPGLSYPQKSFTGAVISGNKVSASPVQVGQGMFTFDFDANSWANIQVSGNTLSNLEVGFGYWRNDWVRTGISNNVCTNVKTPGFGCN